MEKLNFLMGLHCHQPVDNFERIFEEAFNKSYEPFVGVLEKHPGIKLSFHYSGSLLDWIVEKKPHFLERIRKLIDRNQVEILTGGYFEPILPMIPSRDIKGQIGMLTDALRKHFNYTPSGIWLAERVWNPQLAGLLNGLNIKYTLIDDFHLTNSGIKANRVFGHYSIKGFKNFSVFASIKKLRYAMPFREVHVTINFLRELLGKEDVRSVTLADDCEKFGLWPYTYDWVYKKAWLEKFFTQIEQNDWIKTSTFSEALKESASLGEIDIPHSSYAEMMEWCGGNFDNFFRKYPESDFMKKRMLHASRKVAESSRDHDTPQKGKRLKEAKTELYKAQSNCPYWHGIFSGIYLNYLRQGVYRHIIKAENALANSSENRGIELLNLKNNSRDIICMRNETFNLFIDPNYAGALIEMDYKPLSYNLLNTMTRRHESYHEKLSVSGKVDPKKVAEKIDKNESLDLYEVLGVKERNLKRFLNYDPYRKFSLLCHFMDLKTGFSDFARSTHVNPEKNELFGSYAHEEEIEGNKPVTRLKRCGNVEISGEPHKMRLNKCVVLEKDSQVFIRLDLENESTKAVKFLFGVEFNWSVEDRAFMHNRQKRRIKQLALSDRLSSLRINHVFEEPLNFWSFPLYTVNESERGIAKSFQEVSLLFYRKLYLRKNGKFSLGSRIKISG